MSDTRGDTSRVGGKRPARGGSTLFVSSSCQTSLRRLGEFFVCLLLDLLVHNLVTVSECGTIGSSFTQVETFAMTKRTRTTIVEIVVSLLDILVVDYLVFT